MDEEKPELGMGSVIVAALWLAVSVAGASVIPKFRAMFEEMSGPGGAFALPGLTKVLLAIPGSGWAAVGILGALAVIAKSLLLPPDSSRILDIVAFAVLCLVALGIVIGLFLPLIQLQNALAS